MHDKLKKILIAGGVLALGALMAAFFLLDNQIIGAAKDQEVKERYQEHLATHSLNYNTREENNLRFNIFQETDQMIKEHNSEGHNYQLGHNHLSTWTEDEKKKLRGAKPTIAAQYNNENEQYNNFLYAETAHYDDPTDPSYTAIVDYRAMGCVNPVKNQGQCGSCYSFGSSVAIEGWYCKNNGYVLPNVAEQQIVSCSQSFGNNGCDGGWPTNVFQYAKSKNLVSYDSYPYVSGTTQVAESCDQTNATGGNVTVGNMYQVTQNSSSAMKGALAHYGPVVIAIDASSNKFNYYSGGIFDDADCGLDVDHAVALVGYGTDPTTQKEYYILRNSWSTYWGEEGYMRIAVTDGPGMCACQTYPYLAEGKPV